MGSIAALEAGGFLDEYLSLLMPAHRDFLLNLVAGIWVPMDVAAAHYTACEGLGLTLEQQLANGRFTFNKLRGTLLGTFVRMARETGVSPWDVFPIYPRFWGRGYDGGGIRVCKLGPKEARFELVELPLNNSTYYRNALRGLLTSVTELFCRRAFVSEKPGARVSASVTYKVQWV